MLAKIQLIIYDFYNIPIGNVKYLASNFFDKENYVLHYYNLHLYFRLGLKLKNAWCIRIQSITIAKRICPIQYTKKIEAEKK